jgi:hypothetical protein
MAQDPGAPPPSAPEEPQADEGGPEKAIEALGQGLSALAQALPEFQPVLDAFTQAAQKSLGGSGPTTMEQGSSGAQPMSMARP